jgi:hypothetical protein
LKLDTLAENLAVLAARQPDLAAALAMLPPGPVEIFPSASGVPSARVHRAGTPALPLHSRYDPIKEARQSIAWSDLAGADHYVLLGFGLGYPLEALLEQNLDAEAAFFVVESDLQILLAAFAARDLRSLLSLPRLHFAWPVSGPALAEQWKSFLDPVRARKNAFVPHPPSIALAPDLFRSAAEIIQSETFQVFTDINTLVAQSRTFLENFQRNLPFSLPAPGVNVFAGQFRGIPGILVSAGPSLDKNIHELRHCSDRALILATDTTLKPLLAAGIEPHFVLTGDPNYANYLHLKGVPVNRALLVAESTAHPACFEDFSGRTVVCSYENSSLRSIAGILNHKGVLRAWGSVATMALDFAFLLGCDPVIFVGQDLAHSSNRTYCSGLYFQDDWFAGNIGPEDWQKRWDEHRSQYRVIQMTDIFGHPVETTDRLAAYWNWITKEIEAHKGIRFVNATEGGILKDGVEVISLREALFRYAVSKRAIRQHIQDLFDAGRGKPPSLEAAAFRALSKEARQIESILCAGISRDSSDSPEKLHRRLEGRKDQVYAEAPGLASLLDCFNQMGNLQFLRRRSALRASSSAEQVRSVYEDYFATLRQAMEIVRPALQDIEGVLGACRGGD